MGIEKRSFDVLTGLSLLVIRQGRPLRDVVTHMTVRMQMTATHSLTTGTVYVFTYLLRASSDSVLASGFEATYVFSRPGLGYVHVPSSMSIVSYCEDTQPQIPKQYR